MNVKVPACYDLSDYVYSVDWATISPRPILLISRASLGLYYQDKKFLEFMTAAKVQGMKRGAYHYYTAANDPIKQAENFIDAIQEVPDDDMLLILDVEEANISAGMMWTWLEYVRARYPRNKQIIYSRKNILDPISMTQGEKDYFKKIMTWTAGYPTNPDLFDTVPSAYIPDQTKYGKVVLWQYGLSDTVQGIRGETDLNWISPEFLQILGGELPQDATVDLYPGVVQHSGVCNGWRWWIHIVEPSKVMYEVVNLGQLSTVSSIAKSHGAQLAWNGSDYDRTTHQLHKGAPSFRESGDVRNDSNGAVYSVSVLIENGAIHPRVYWSDLTATEGHTRTCFGKTADGKIMHFVSEGKYPNQGLLLKECATLMQKYGAVLAGSSGGGGDTALVINGQLVNVPEDIDGGVNVERRIPQVLLAYVQEGNTMNGTAKERLGKTSTVRDIPSRYGNSVGSIAPNSTIEFVEIVPVTVKGIADNREDKWFKLPDGHYVNYILNGTLYYTVLTMPAEPPPPPADDYFIHYLPDGTTKKYVAE